jgi:hypothetical protein
MIAGFESGRGKYGSVLLTSHDRLLTGAKWTKLEDNIKIESRELCYDDVNWAKLA